MDQTTLLLARWFSVVIGGLFSWSMIDLVVSGRLQYYLADQKFEILVISGGVALALMALLKCRQLVLAGSGGHDHAHEHHEHNHGGGSCGNGDCCCDHDHHESVSLWRYIVLVVPLMIVWMGLAPNGLSADVFSKRMTKAQREAIAAASSAALPEGRKVDTDAEPIDTDMRELQQASQDAVRRQFWETADRPVRLSGQFVPDNRYTDRYRLMRIRITCCAADATPIDVTVVGEIQSGWQYGEWLEALGVVSFVEVPGGQTQGSKYLPVLHQLHVSVTDPKPYIQ